MTNVRNEKINFRVKSGACVGCTIWILANYASSTKYFDTVDNFAHFQFLIICRHNGASLESSRICGHDHSKTAVYASK